MTLPRDRAARFPLPARPARRHRGPALAAIVVAVLLAHAGMALGLSGPGDLPPALTARAPAVETRLVAPAPPRPDLQAPVMPVAQSASTGAAAAATTAPAAPATTAPAAPATTAAARPDVSAGARQAAPGIAGGTKPARMPPPSHAMALPASADAAAGTGTEEPAAGPDGRQDTLDRSAAEPASVAQASADTAPIVLAAADAQTAEQDAARDARAQSGETEAAPVAADDGPPPPVYPAKPPASTVLRYEMSRGIVSGDGELRWRADASGYEASLEGSVLGLSVLAWRSNGGFDSAGLAPLRFTDKRRGRSMYAANFQRDKGLISYSGPSVRYKLVPGAQDRLSWMVQLAAVALARPAAMAPGERFTFLVSGARGDADAWSFVVQKTERIALPVGTVEAIHLVREPRKPHDTRVDVWIDPSRQYLPVKARMAQEGEDPFELALAGTAKP